MLFHLSISLCTIQIFDIIRIELCQSCSRKILSDSFSRSNTYIGIGPLESWSIVNPSQITKSVNLEIISFANCQDFFECSIVLGQIMNRIERKRIFIQIFIGNGEAKFAFYQFPSPKGCIALCNF